MEVLRYHGATGKLQVMQKLSETNVIPFYLYRTSLYKLTRDADSEGDAYMKFLEINSTRICGFHSNIKPKGISSKIQKLKNYTVLLSCRAASSSSAEENERNP